MDDTNKMLKTIINGQSAMKSELLTKIEKLEKKVDVGFKDVYSHINSLDKKLTKRIDKIGLAVARLEDDTPTSEEFDNLVIKVDNIAKKITVN